MYSGKAAALTALLLALIAQADAVTIKKALLGLPNGWKDNRITRDAAGDIPCNYIYTDYHDRLLYYGTSSRCNRRLSQHANNINHQLVFLAQMESLLTEAKNQAQPYTGWRNPVWDWSSQVQKDQEGNDLGPYQERGTSDMCLATNQNATGSPVGIWYLKLESGARAAKVEGCVLEHVVGFCNRKGHGTVSPSGQDFMNTVNSCVAAAVADKSSYDSKDMSDEDED